MSKGGHDREAILEKIRKVSPLWTEPKPAKK
jgi:hypothetical protein